MKQFIQVSLILVAMVLFGTGCDLTKKTVSKVDQNTKGSDDNSATKGIDSDGDGISDLDEARLGTDPRNADSDGDGLSDGDEVNTYKTNPLSRDTDGGGIWDNHEVNRGANPNDPGDDISETADADADGLNDKIEADIGTDPNIADTDNDGLSDGAEVLSYLTDPLDDDSDNGGANDGDEINAGTNPNGQPEDDKTVENDADGDGLSLSEEVALGTDPENPDSDSDGIPDGAEINSLGTDPLNEDSDSGGVFDGNEVSNGTNPLNEEDDDSTSSDIDNDGLTGAQEAILGTQADNPDSDEDGLSDGSEVLTHQTNPLSEDSDGGSVNDGEEVGRGTDPLDAHDDFKELIIRLTKTPKTITKSKKAVFQFSVDEIQHMKTAQCTLDGKNLESCEPLEDISLNKLDLGSHVFSITVVDLLNRQSTAQFQWMIKERNRDFPGCEGSQRQRISIPVQFEAMSNECSFGANGNLEKKNGFLQAIESQQKTFQVGNNWDICEMEIIVDEQNFKADDHFVLTWNNLALLSNGPYMLSPGDNGKVFDFENAKGKRFGADQSFCFGSDMGSSCTVPKHDQNQKLSYDLSDKTIDQLVLHANRQSSQEIKLSVGGDNDSSDCQHSGLKMQINVYKARVN